MGMCRRGIRAPVFGGCAAGEDGMGRIEAKNTRKKGGRIVMILTCVRYFFFFLLMLVKTKKKLVYKNAICPCNAFVNLVCSASVLCYV